MKEIERMFDQKGISAFIDEGDIKDILLNEVADEMEKILMSHISSDIYGGYSPHIYRHWGATPPGWKAVSQDGKIQYQRRGSLLNRGDIVREIVDGNTAFVSSDAKPNQSVYGSSWVPYGTGAFLMMLSTHPGSFASHIVRPALQNAQAEVDTSGAVQKAFERGLKRHGYT